MNKDVFGMSDEDFFAEPLIVSPDVGDGLIESGFYGLRIDGPERVELDKRSVFPLVTVRVAESMDASRWLFKEFAVLTAMDLVSGTLHAAFYIEQKSVKAPRDLEKNPPPPGSVARSASADLFKRLRIPRTASEYLVTVVLLDKISNRIRVKVGESGILRDNAAFKMEIGKRIPDKFPRIEVPERRNRQDGKPQVSEVDVPQESGIEGRVELRSVAQGNELEPWLQLAYRLPFLGKELKGYNDSVDAGMTPVSIELLATGTRNPSPWVRHLAHSGIRNRVAGEEAVIEGRMDIRLADLGGLQGNQIYYLYAFAGEWMSSPIKLDWQNR